MPRESDDLVLLIRAAHFAAQRHRDHRRKDAKGRPYINHPIALAATLSDAGVRDADVLAAAFLHDTIEDTNTTYDDLRGEFGTAVADLVVEVTDTKFLEKASRKRMQVARAGHASDGAKLVKLADKICNLRDMLGSPPAGWSVERRQRYFDWAKEVIDEIRGTNAELERTFDRLYRQRPVALKKLTLTIVPTSSKPLSKQQALLERLQDPEVWIRARAAQEAEDNKHQAEMSAEVKAREAVEAATKTDKP